MNAPIRRLSTVVAVLFMILLVLIQKGKGGGLIGALGGTGGSSPFGSRAGDQFTRLTIYVACLWLLLTMIEVRVIQNAAGNVQGIAREQ